MTLLEEVYFWTNFTQVETTNVTRIGADEFLGNSFQNCRGIAVVGILQNGSLSLKILKQLMN